MSKIHFYTARYAERFILALDKGIEVALGYPTYVPALSPARFYVHTICDEEGLEIWRLTDAATGCFMAEALDRTDLHGQVDKLFKKRTPCQLLNYLAQAAIKFGTVPAASVIEKGASHE